MTVITTHLTVACEGTVSVATKLPAGEHAATITVAAPPAANTVTLRDFPRHDEPWDDSISLRRDDLYDDDGRLG